MEHKEKIQEAKQLLCDHVSICNMLLSLLDSISEEKDWIWEPRVDKSALALFWSDSVNFPAVYLKPEIQPKPVFDVFERTNFTLTTEDKPSALQAVRSMLQRVDSAATRKLAEHLRQVVGRDSLHYTPLFARLCPFANKFPDMSVNWASKIPTKEVFLVKLGQKGSFHVSYDIDSNPVYTLSFGAEKFLV